MKYMLKLHDQWMCRGPGVAWSSNQDDAAQFTQWELLNYLNFNFFPEREELQLTIVPCKTY